MNQGRLGLGVRKWKGPEQIRKGTYMLWTIAVILLILWMLGLVTSYTLGGFIHILLVLAIIIVVINLLSGRGAL